MTKKMAVLGAGAIGGTIGGHLTMAGHDVTLIDQWPENVEEGLKPDISNLRFLEPYVS